MSSPEVAHAPHEPHAPVAGVHAPSHQFDTIEQQHEAATLGMWAFLITEVMFFGGLFLLYTVYRFRFPEAFGEASSHLDVTLGAINTAILIGSSLTMALAVRSAQLGRRKAIAGFLVATIVLGGAFLGIKAVEYAHKFHEGFVPGPHFKWPGAIAEQANAGQLYFGLYFAMTGLHALHMVLGAVLLGVLAVLALRGKFDHGYSNPVEMAGLYWHFVDLVWIFLFPLLYLIRRHH
jgi:cytochrome c oxidase subunit III